MASKTIGTTTNFTDTAPRSGPIAVGSTTAITILEAEVVAPGDPPKRLYVWITVQSKDTWIRLRPALEDNLGQDILWPSDGMPFTLTPLNMYYGEISAITKLGNAIINVVVL